MHATPPDPLDVDTYSEPHRRDRFVAAMERIAAKRTPGAPVRVYISAAPRAMNSPKWDGWLTQIQAALPEGTETLHFRNAFGDDRPYDWQPLAQGLDGLVIVGKQKRPGGRVYLLGPVARDELRSLIAHKPVLLYAHEHGLIPVIDCKHQLLGEGDGEKRLKLTAPKRWKRDSMTLRAALDALRPSSAEQIRTDESASHLVHPFTPPH